MPINFKVIQVYKGMLPEFMVFKVFKDFNKYNLKMGKKKTTASFPENNLTDENK